MEINVYNYDKKLLLLRQQQFQQKAVQMQIEQAFHCMGLSNNQEQIVVFLNVCLCFDQEDQQVVVNPTLFNHFYFNIQSFWDWNTHN